MSETILQFVGTCEIQAAADQAQAPRVSILAYSGGSMSPKGWPAVVVDLAGADVSGDIPLLAGHADDLDSVAGQGRATIHNQQLHVQGTLTQATPAGQKVVALARSGISLQASIGFTPDRREQIPAGQRVTVNGRTLTAGPQGLTVVRSGRLRECSLVAIGADPDTQVTIAAKAALHKKGTRRMADETTTTSVETPDEIKAAWDKPGLTDAERIRARLNATSFSDETLRGDAHTLMFKATAGQLSFADFDRELMRIELRDARLQAIRTERPQAPAIHASQRDLSAAAIEGALLCRLGQESLAEKTLGAEAVQRGRNLGIHHALDIIKASLALEHRDTPAGPDGMIRAAFSTASLPSILSNVANKLLLDSYRAFPSAARMIARKLSANDFKSHTGVRLTGDVVMKGVGHSGELAHGTLTDAAFTYSVGTFGRIFGVTRQMWRNDDLSALSEIPRVLGRGAALALEDAFWTLVLANTGTFFGSGNKNYISGATTTLDATGLGLGVTTFLKLVDPDGNPIGVTPRFLVVPPELKVAADQLYRSSTLLAVGTAGAVTQVPSASTFYGMYEPIASPYLSNSNYTGNSALAWYLFGDPGDVAAFGLAYLDGQENPTVEQVDEGADVLGVAWRGYLDFGCCQIDPRGAVKSKGAA